MLLVLLGNITRILGQADSGHDGALILFLDLVLIEHVMDATDRRVEIELVGALDATLM